MKNLTLNEAKTIISAMESMAKQQGAYLENTTQDTLRLAYFAQHAETIQRAPGFSYSVAWDNRKPGKAWTDGRELNVTLLDNLRTAIDKAMAAGKEKEA